MRKEVFFPNLDAIRFVAFFVVFLSHSVGTDSAVVQQTGLYQAAIFAFNFGTLGVNLFFVLSGFLITYLLSVEENANHKIDVVSFYIRRILRIWPLYLLCVVYGFFLRPLLKALSGVPVQETANPLMYLAFLGNFDFIKHGMPDAYYMGVFWSIAVEEQFYLLWPLLMVVFRRQKPVLFSAVIVIAVVFRYFHANQPLVLYYHSLSVISDMAVGGLFGWLCLEYKQLISYFQALPRYIIVLAYAAGTGVIFFHEKIFVNTLLIAIERLAYSLFFIFIILEQNFAGHSFYKGGKWKFVSYWGKYTYGMYCLNLLGGAVLSNAIFHRLHLQENTLWMVLIVKPLLILSITMVLAWLSYQYVEKYFVKLKNRFAYVTE